MPKKHLGKLVTNGVIKTRVCRREAPVSDCMQAGELVLLAPGATGRFAELLPASLISGQPRALYYSIELLDRHGRSTGTSNAVPTLAGSP
ncbi:MAG TPA: hypothetical protein VF786_15175, partial [Terriglobales bacterium]